MKVPVLFLFVLITTFATAQIKGKVHYEQFGISFEIPDGWVGQEAQDVLILGATTMPGMLLIATHTHDIAELIKESEKGIHEGNGTSFLLDGTLKKGKNFVAGNFKGTLEWQPAKSHIIGVANPYGIGVTIMAITSPDEFTTAYQTLCEEIRQSLVFAKVDRTTE